MTDELEDLEEPQPVEVTRVEPHAVLATEPWSPDMRRGRVWLTAAAVACLLAVIIGPLVLIGMDRLSADEALDLILRMSNVLSAPLALIAGYHFLEVSRQRPATPCPWCKH